MKHLLQVFAILLVVISLRAQTIPQVYPAYTYDRTVNDSIANDLYRQWNMFSTITDTAEVQALMNKLENSQLGYKRRGEFRQYRIPLIMTAFGCGFYECLEPTKLKTTQNGKRTKDTVLYDFFMQTAWQVKDWQKSSIGIYFPRSQSEIATLIFFPGNFRSDTAWAMDHRLKKALLKVNGRKTAILNFSDCMCEQELKLPEAITFRKRKKLTIIPLEVYPGTSGLLSVSEINFDGYNCH